MVSKTWNAMLVAVVASAITITSSAQTRPQSAPITAIVMPPGTGAATYRAMTMSLQRLNNPALNLTPEQMAEISKVIDGFVAEQMALDKSSPVARGSKPSRAELQDRKSAVAKLTAKLGQVMNDEQRRKWEADVIAHHPAVTRSPDGSRAGSRGN